MLGMMVSASALVPFLVGVPAGKLADRIGRKRMIYLVTPVAYFSNLLLILAPCPAALVAVGFLQGFYMVGMLLTRAMTAEMVPAERMGRWMGTVGLFNGLVAASAAFIGEFIWDSAGPAYVFLTAVCIYLGLRIPLLIGMPETLGTRNAANG